MELKDLGFKEWFQEKAEELQFSENSIARVTAVDKDSFLIRNESAEIPAEITGKIRYSAETALDFPTVGDWVGVQYFDDMTHAIIHQILTRKSLLKRKTAGRKIDYQLIAANIDTAFIMQSLDTDFNIRRLERYLIMVNESNIEPVILLSKCDLISEEEQKQKVLEIGNLKNPYETITFSNTTGERINDIQKLIRKGETYCLLGSSGVGKTTLLNSLIGEDVFETSSVREKDGKGRHITSRRQLTILESGGLIIDTPGMRELANLGIETGIEETFADINSLIGDCHFRDCTHTNEPGCSVLEAIEKGELSQERYQSYLKLRKESEYYNSSCLEKRNKNRKFGKMVKEALKYNKRK